MDAEIVGRLATRKKSRSFLMRGDILLIFLDVLCGMELGEARIINLYECRCLRCTLTYASLLIHTST
jgi:hypothetical protein